MKPSKRMHPRCETHPYNPLSSAGTCPECVAKPDLLEKKRIVYKHVKGGAGRKKRDEGEPEVGVLDITPSSSGAMVRIDGVLVRHA